MRKFLNAALIALAASGAAYAQEPRPAVALDLSPADAATAFEQAVIEGCVRTVSNGELILDLPRAARRTYSVSSDPKLRAQAGAGPDETVWSVEAARGVVVIREKNGRCAVSVYGPPVVATIVSLTARLTDPDMGFARLAGPGGEQMSLQRKQSGRTVQVMIRGAEPGDPGNKSRFSVVTATVFEMKPG